MPRLGLVLDQLPSGPAGQTEVTVYLATLIRWLNTDPWPQETRFAGLALTPAAIERKLSITDSDGLTGGRDLDADDLARRCTRLVVLGAPGSGKTWLARRTARLCAEAALAALAGGALLDEIELPLYITCARLSAAPPGDGIRRAVVASALGQLPDLGGSRVVDAVRVLFEDRDAPTLLVADSLDEARGADERIRQADTLPAAWRIVLTSRPGSWNRQLVIDDDPSRRVGVLQPLRYPDNVEPFIAAWFSGRPAWAASLAAQLRDRPDLQQAATVPLILAFYCIVGGGLPLPGRRVDLYAKVIRRVLTGRWRGAGAHDPDPDACLETLRGWAWSAAASNPVSGVGDWLDEFPTQRVRQSQDDRDALDHVAVPLEPPELDTGMTRRRFVHRSIQEHLVAEHVALRMHAKEAAAELLNHLWFDPDWEYSGPAALAMHPQHEGVLKELICRLTGADRLTVDLAAIDGSWEIRRFLARVARESSENGWSGEAAELIGRARTDLAMWRRGDLPLVVANDWPTSNRLIIEWLLVSLDRETETARERVGAVTRLAVAPEERAQAREALLTLLGRRITPSTARQLVEAVARLAATPQERMSARQALLTLLARETGPGRARVLAEAIMWLDPLPEERVSAREALLTLLARRISPQTARQLAEVVARLAATPQERASAREALLTLLARETRLETAQELVEAVMGLDPVPQERPRRGRRFFYCSRARATLGEPGCWRRRLRGSR